MLMEAFNIDQGPEFSPPAVVTTLSCWNGERFVVRDDLLPGGTKQRALAPYLLDLQRQGFHHFTYASPFSGFAQIALAYVAKTLNLPCTIVCERDQREPNYSVFHPFSMLAHKFGAHVILVDSLAEAEEVATTLTERVEASFKIPLGFDSPIFRSHLKEALSLQWQTIVQQIPISIKTLWLPVGSGTLAKTFREVIPSQVQMKCLNVRVLEDKDFRLDLVRQLPMLSMLKASMPFHVEADTLPEVPSNLFYDAKIWRYLNLDGEDGDLWWNVAR